MKHITIQTLL